MPLSSKSGRAGTQCKRAAAAPQGWSQLPAVAAAAPPSRQPQQQLGQEHKNIGGTPTWSSGLHHQQLQAPADEACLSVEHLLCLQSAQLGQLDDLCHFYLDFCVDHLVVWWQRDIAQQYASLSVEHLAAISATWQRTSHLESLGLARARVQQLTAKAAWNAASAGFQSATCSNPAQSSTLEPWTKPADWTHRWLARHRNI